MVSITDLVLGLYLATPTVVAGARIPGGHVERAAKYEPKFRLSPIDGSKIALPTKEQLAWQDQEIGVIIHYELATYLNLDGCNRVPDLVPDINLWKPAELNMDQWLDSIEALGAKYGTLVAKHNCGFALWPSKTHFPLKDGADNPYNYTVADAPDKTDIVKAFIGAAKKRDIGTGFYYSVNVNNFLNVQDSVVRPNETLAPGQVRITNETFGDIVNSQLEELWSNYEDLTEIWFDGGYTSEQMAGIQTLLETHQPQAILFGGCYTEETCLPNSVRWIGNENGEAPEENWSTGFGKGGDPESPYFLPSECDTTLQTENRWFYGKDHPLRSLDEMKQVYHTSVGRNCFLELDLAPDTRGIIPDDHAARYKELGDFIRSCYGNAVQPGSTYSDNQTGGFSMKWEEPAAVDRISLMEDQTNGQVIRSYHVYGKTEGGNGEWTLLSNGTSVGHKKIDIFGKAVLVTEIKVNSTYVDTPKWRSITLHKCDE